MIQDFNNIINTSQKSYLLKFIILKSNQNIKNDFIQYVVCTKAVFNLSLTYQLYFFGPTSKI